MGEENAEDDTHQKKTRQQGGGSVEGTQKVNTREGKTRKASEENVYKPHMKRQCNEMEEKLRGKWRKKIDKGTR